MATSIFTETEQIDIDATLSLVKNFKASVTRFPVEIGSEITDNISVANRQFTLEGIISDATLVPRESTDLGTKGAKDVKVLDVRRSISIGGINLGIPASISQFLPSEGKPNITTGPAQDRRASAFEDILERIFKNKEILTIEEEVKGDGSSKRIHENLVMINLSITRNKDTKRAVSFSAGFTQVRFATSAIVTLQKTKETEELGAEETEDRSDVTGKQKSVSESEADAFFVRKK